MNVFSFEASIRKEFINIFGNTHSSSSTPSIILSFLLQFYVAFTGSKSLKIVNFINHTVVNHSTNKHFNQFNQNFNLKIKHLKSFALLLFVHCFCLHYFKIEFEQYEMIMNSKLPVNCDNTHIDFSKIALHNFELYTHTAHIHLHCDTNGDPPWLFYMYCHVNGETITPSWYFELDRRSLYWNISIRYRRHFTTL